MRRGGTWIQRWRVPLGFLCAALFIWLAQPRPVTLVIGGAISLVGLLMRAWAAGHIRKNTVLATTGPYAYTRNPLYLGSFLLALGFTVGAGRWLLGLLFAGLFLGIYLPVMRVESTTLAQKFGEDYQRYASEVPLFIPRIKRFSNKRNEATKFDSALYLRYREYRAALGLLIAWGILAVKAYLR
ncbi:MAG: methyltransferase family protein [Pyrinomonadaceae bacterium]